MIRILHNNLEQCGAFQLMVAWFCDQCGRPVTLGQLGANVMVIYWDPHFPGGGRWWRFYVHIGCWHRWGGRAIQNFRWCLRPGALCFKVNLGHGDAWNDMERYGKNFA